MAYKMDLLVTKTNALIEGAFVKSSYICPILYQFERIESKDFDYIYHDLGSMIIPMRTLPVNYWDFDAREHEYYVLEEPYDWRETDKSLYTYEPPIWTLNLPTAVYRHWNGTGLTPTSSSLQHKLIL